LVPLGWRVLYTCHQAIETQVAAGQRDAGADYNRNRNVMIEQGLIKVGRQKVSVARLVLQRPQRVLADEPPAALDPVATHQVVAVLRAAADPADGACGCADPDWVDSYFERITCWPGYRLADAVRGPDADRLEAPAWFHPDMERIMPDEDWRWAPGLGP